MDQTELVTCGSAQGWLPENPREGAPPMSGPKCVTVVHVPSPEEIRAAAQARLDQVNRSIDAELSRAALLAASLAERAPEASASLRALQRPAIDGAGTDPQSAVVRASAALTRLQAQIASAQQSAIAEEIRIIRRAAATEVQLGHATRAGGAAAAGTSQVERTEVELGTETVTASRANATPMAVPAAEARVSRIQEVLARGDGAVSVETAGSLLHRASDVDGLLAWASVLDEARKAVDRALGARDRRRADVLLATTLSGRLIGLSGDDVEHVRAQLDACLNGGAPLPTDMRDQVEQVHGRAVRRQVLHLLLASGCAPLVDDADIAVGYVDHGDGTASRVQLDEQGLLIAPVADHPLDTSEVAQLEASNCEFLAAVQRDAHRYDLDVTIVRQRPPGTTPIRVDALPAGISSEPMTSQAGQVEESERRSSESDTLPSDYYDDIDTDHERTF